MEYRLSKGWLVIIVLFAAASLYFGIYLLTHSSAPTTGGRTGILFIGGVFAAAGLFLAMVSWTTVLTIDDNAITVNRIFFHRSIPLDDIDGYATGDKGSLYVAAKSDGRKIWISAYLANREELLDWLKARYPDLNKLRKERDKQVILHNELYGSTPEERINSLRRAFAFCIGFSVIAFLLFAWLMFNPQPYYDLLMILALISPLAGLFLIWSFRGLIRLAVKKGSGYPAMFYGYFFLILAVAVGSLMQYKIYQWSIVAWQLIALSAVSLTIIAIIACRLALVEEKRRLLAWSLIFLFALAYSYGLVVFANCSFDRSTPQIFPVIVTGKHISQGKSTTYYLELSSWGRFENGKEVQVSPSFYNDVEEKDALSVFLNRGRLNIPWYQVVKR